MVGMLSEAGLYAAIRTTRMGCGKHAHMAAAAARAAAQERYRSRTFPAVPFGEHCSIVCRLALHACATLCLLNSLHDGMGLVANDFESGSRVGDKARGGRAVLQRDLSSPAGKFIRALSLMASMEFPHVTTASAAGIA